MILCWPLTSGMIAGLAEAGLISSKLSRSDLDQDSPLFSPER